MSLSFNEFQRELQKRGIKPHEAYMFTLIYERLIETEKIVMDAMNVLSEMADTMASFATLSEQTQKDLKRALRGGRPDGIEVESVAWDKSDD